MKGTTRLAVVLVALSACVFPTDRSAQFQLVLDPIPAMFVGDTFPLSARFAGEPPPGASAQDFLFASDDPAVAIVTPAHDLIAVGTGPAMISVRIPFADTPADTRTIVVNTGVRVDSAVPQTVIFGDTLRIYGIGLNPAVTTVTLGGVRPLVESYARAIPTSANGPGVLTVVVIPPAGPTARIRAAGARGATTSSFAIGIEQRDRYEPNGAAPADLGTLSGEWSDAVLALEASGVADSQLNRDWYTFTNPAFQNVKIVLWMDAPFTSDEVSLALSDSLTADGFARADYWVIAPGLNYCRGAVVRVPAVAADSQTILVSGLPSGTYHVQVRARAPLLAARRYGLAIREAGSLPLSDDEENDHCFAASATLPEPRPPGQGQFAHTLTIDTPGDADWFRFAVADTVRLAFSLGIPLPSDRPSNPIARFPLLELLTDSAQVRHVAGGALAPDGTLPTVLDVTLEPGAYYLVASDVFGALGDYGIGVELRETAAAVRAAPPAADESP